MSLNPLPDLFAHMEWADALSWRTLAAHPGALDDANIRERLHHIHLVQRAFCCILREEPIVYRKLEEYTSTDELKADAQRYLGEIRAIHDGFAVESLSETVAIPWFKDPPIVIQRSQVLLQVAMHTQHHRGQNATRLREIGGEPTDTDFILWIWKGRPGPEW